MKGKKKKKLVFSYQETIKIGFGPNRKEMLKKCQASKLDTKNAFPQNIKKIIR